MVHSTKKWFMKKNYLKKGCFLRAKSFMRQARCKKEYSEQRKYWGICKKNDRKSDARIIECSLSKQILTHSSIEAGREIMKLLTIGSSKYISLKSSGYTTKLRDIGGLDSKYLKNVHLIIMKIIFPRSYILYFKKIQ